MTWGFGHRRCLTHAAMPRMRCVCRGSDVCRPLPSDPTSRWAPLRFGEEFLSSRPPRDLPPQVTSRSAFACRLPAPVTALRAMPGAQRDREGPHGLPPSHTTGQTGHGLRWFGRLSQGEPSPPPQPPPQRASSQFIPDAGRTAQHLAGCYLAAPRQARTPGHRSGPRLTRVAAWPIRCPAFRPWGASLASPAAGLLCPLLTSARWSGGIAPPSVLHEDTPQISRGKLSYLLCIGARFIKHSPLWMEGFAVACQLAPTVPHLVSGSCPSPRTFVPRFLQTPPHGDALAFPLSFGSTYTWTGDFHPRA
jgi:hypothetical protein